MSIDTNNAHKSTLKTEGQRLLETAQTDNKKWSIKKYIVNKTRFVPLLAPCGKIKKLGEFLA